MSGSLEYVLIISGKFVNGKVGSVSAYLERKVAMYRPNITSPKNSISTGSCGLSGSIVRIYAILPA